MSDGVDSHILRSYDIQKRLGKGAYGIVWKATDKRSKEVVALKKIFDAFRNQTDAQRTYREIVFLREFGEHPNIIRLQNVLRADNDRDIYLVFEFMEADLHNVIRKGTILKDTHKRYVMYQLLKAMKYLHSANVIHRDMKPSNVLINQQCRVKLCDFGLARSLNYVYEDVQHPALTEYVGKYQNPCFRGSTRWYRAPEILLASSKYTKGVDMWSIGCILGEMLLGKPLFQGTSTFNQLERILQHIASPSQAACISSQYGPSVLERAAAGPKKSLDNLIPSANDDTLDLLKRLLHFNPDKRITAEEGLRHNYVISFHNPNDEMIKGYDVVPQLSDDIQLTVEEYRKKLYELIQLRKVSAKPGNVVSNHNSNSDVGIVNRTTNVIQPTRSVYSASENNNNNEVIAQQAQYHGTSAYIDQSEYDSYKKHISNTQTTKPSTNNNHNSNYNSESTSSVIHGRSHANNTNNDGFKNRQRQYTNDVDEDYTENVGQYSKGPTPPYSSLLGRSHSYNGMSSTQGQTRVLSTKQRTTSNSNITYQKSSAAAIREKSANRGYRSGSAPTPTPPPKTSGYYSKRPTVVFGSDPERNGTQANVNNKFIANLRPNSADTRSKNRFTSTQTNSASNGSNGYLQNSSSTFGFYSNQSAARRPQANYNNMTSSMAARDNLGGYNQANGTISQNGLRVLDGLLHHPS
ncbi:unnamed protein product [Didymodactylos carnosus]|uniref:Mitogen-activated protein kinase n=1 Tax=Didymodactylos carnosus TaxID=1234261 RepID=A0A813RIR1_9BILA|nr:unnamed protein product [Didymodactylos carnosus]CAF1193781.1 unnamed protein product [Didymodactylos carnosus]CAF3566486.1 unnamed protein product [Didymodactylos carnosus]CAF4004077.1 unnamed protein product [Didymodactylos carnosus]